MQRSHVIGMLLQQRQTGFLRPLELAFLAQPFRLFQSDEGILKRIDRCNFLITRQGCGLELFFDAFHFFVYI